jgi:hypothetical protein
VLRRQLWNPLLVLHSLPLLHKLQLRRTWLPPLFHQRRRCCSAAATGQCWLPSDRVPHLRLGLALLMATQVPRQLLAPAGLRLVLAKPWRLVAM